MFQRSYKVGQFDSQEILGPFLHHKRVYCNHFAWKPSWRSPAAAGDIPGIGDRVMISGHCKYESASKQPKVDNCVQRVASRSHQTTTYWGPVGLKPDPELRTTYLRSPGKPGAPVLTLSFASAKAREVIG
ncbi:hypothetical protein SFRURICE_021454 [Spodoptera frugiperda]|nr:hypothetical protein SFRURICE_021454 [Spodoptera frugiperda]